MIGFTFVTRLTHTIVFFFFNSLLNKVIPVTTTASNVYRQFTEHIHIFHTIPQHTGKLVLEESALNKQKFIFFIICWTVRTLTHIRYTVFFFNTTSKTMLIYVVPFDYFIFFTSIVCVGEKTLVFFWKSVFVYVIKLCKKNRSQNYSNLNLKMRFKINCF